MRPDTTEPSTAVPAFGQAYAPPPPLLAAPAWTASQLIAFRFAFVYLILYNLPFPLSLPPIGGPVAWLYDRMWFAIVRWFGAHVLRIVRPIEVSLTEISDSRFAYVRLLLFVLIAVVATILWSFRDRRRTKYHRLQHGLWIYIRYALADTLLSYGAAKIVRLQFPTPRFTQLLQPYSNFTPWMRSGRGWASPPPITSMPASPSASPAFSCSSGVQRR